MGGCDVGNALVDGRHGSRQRVGRLHFEMKYDLGALYAGVEMERKGLDKICAKGKKRP